MALTDDTPS